jgi:hypothetical protein
MMATRVKKETENKSEEELEAAMREGLAAVNELLDGTGEEGLAKQGLKAIRAYARAGEREIAAAKKVLRE